MRILHTMLRVGNLEKSLAFYTEVLGMKLLRKKDYPDGKFTLAFVGYQDEADGAVLELTHNWDTDNYTLGDAYGHIALEVDDAYKTCDDVRARGGKVVPYKPLLDEAVALSTHKPSAPLVAPPSGLGSGSGMKAVTLPSFTDPMRMPRCQPGL